MASAANAMAIVGQGAQQKQTNLKVVRATTQPNSPLAPGAAIDKIYDPSTQKMLRRIDALMTPFTTDEPAAPPAVTPKVTPDR